MSQGLSLLRAVIESGARTPIRDLDQRLFVSDERPAYDWVMNYYQRFGQLPTMALMTEAGFRLPEASGTVDFYLDRLRQRGIYNSIVGDQAALSAALQARDTNGALEVVRRMNINASHFRSVTDITHLQDAVEHVMQDYEYARSHPGMRGIPFGWHYFDDLTLGAQQGDVITFVARPSMGKSYTIIKCALSAWRAGHSVLFVSMEMTTLQTARRGLAMLAGMNPDLVRRGQLSGWGEERIHEVAQSIQYGPHFHLLSGSLKKSTKDVDALIQELQPEIVFIDASYLLVPDAKASRRGSRWETLAEVGEEIKTISLLRNRPIVQTVQFNRTATKRGQEGGDLSHIGGTDVIGQVSSIVVAIKEGMAPYETTRRRFELLKNRDGQSGSWTSNYLFNPFNMEQVEAGDDNAVGPQPPQLEWML
jgi:replicative DNA helicase